MFYKQDKLKNESFLFLQHNVIELAMLGPVNKTKRSHSENWEPQHQKDLWWTSHMISSTHLSLGQDLGRPQNYHQEHRRLHIQEFPLTTPNQTKCYLVMRVHICPHSSMTKSVMTLSIPKTTCSPSLVLQKTRVAHSGQRKWDLVIHPFRQLMKTPPSSLSAAMLSSLL